MPARSRASTASFRAAMSTASLLRILKTPRTGRWKQQRPRKSPGPLVLDNYRLLQRGADRAEIGAQLAAEAVDHRDDRERNAGSDQAVFDGSGAGLVLHETRNQILH